MILALLATLGAIVVAFVLLPIFSTGDTAPFDLDAVQRERVDLSESKNRLLESIKDLDFENAAGKLSEADYQTARDDYMTQITGILARLDELSGPADESVPDDTDRAQGAAGDTIACSSCKAANIMSAKFCLECGNALAAPTPECASCGERFLAGAKFCTECGAKATA